jgi:hypothetical protein
MMASIFFIFCPSPGMAAATVPLTQPAVSRLHAKPPDG